jgi:hypothetical protein
MQAIVQTKYGSADVLHLEKISWPAVGDGEVLIRVHAAGLDRGTWHQMAGLPYLFRVMGIGLRAPKNPVPGLDVAGTVEAVGNGVTRFEVGDEVYGISKGSFAEYARAREDGLWSSASPARSMPLIGFGTLSLPCAFEMLVPILTRKRWSVPPHSRWPRPAAGAMGDEDRRYTRARILDLDRMAGVHTAPGGRGEPQASLGRVRRTPQDAGSKRAAPAPTPVAGSFGRGWLSRRYPSWGLATPRVGRC